MTDFARGYVLPGFVPSDPADLLSALLVWDSLDVEAREPPARSDDKVDAYSELVKAGLLRPFAPYLQVEVVVDPSIPPHESEAEWSARVEENGNAFADGLIEAVGTGVREARDLGLAPIALSELTELALALPEPELDFPIAEATAIRIATAGVRVDGQTGVEDLLRFRERNRRLMSRFRAVLGDLAASLDIDDPRRAAERAQATVVNRLEPKLGDLADALQRSRINFTIEALLGATAVSLGPVDTATLALAGGTLALRGLKYAFDRERIVRGHPLGLVYRAHGQFGSHPTSPAPVIDDPRAVLREICVSNLLPLFREPSGNP